MTKGFDSKWKDCQPDRTVAEIKKALEHFGLQTKCTFTRRKSLRECWSCRITLLPPLDFVGANGKGAAREYCLASGYSELMERLQNMSLDRALLTVETELSRENESFRYLSLDELISQTPYAAEFLRQLKEEYHTGSRLADSFLSEYVFMNMAGGKNGRIACSSWYDVNDGKYVYMPRILVIQTQVHNGMAAGNTLEEAIVQAESELFERYVHKRFLSEGLIPPKIPEKVLERYPFVMQAKNEIEKHKEKKVLFFDFSLGLGIPAVMACFLDTDTLQFGISFGAHPDMGIALERCITEVLQGQRSMKECFAKNYPEFAEEKVRSDFNLRNHVTYGAGSIQAKSLFGIPSWEYRPWTWDPSAGNKTLARQLSQKLIDMGARVCIEDVSCLGGVRSVFVAAMGIGEIESLKNRNVTCYLKDLAMLRRCDRWTDEDIPRVMNYAAEFVPVPALDSFSKLLSLPGYPNMDGCSQLTFLLGLCYYRINKREKALQFMKASLKYRSGQGRSTRVRAACLYADAELKGYPADDIRKLLISLTDRKTADFTMEAFSNPEKLMEYFLPVCTGQQCVECRVGGCVCAEYEELMKKVWEKRQECDGRKTLHRIFCMSRPEDASS